MKHTWDFTGARDVKIAFEHDIDLIWYDGPVLWMTHDQDGCKYIGALSDGSKDDGIDRHVYAQFDDDLYAAFMSRQVTLLDIMERAGKVVVVDVGWYDADKIPAMREVNFHMLPVGARPTNKSFLPYVPQG